MLDTTENRLCRMYYSRINKRFFKKKKKKSQMYITTSEILAASYCSTSHRYIQDTCANTQDSILLLTHKLTVFLVLLSCYEVAWTLSS